MNNYEKLLEIMRKQGRRDNPEHPQLARVVDGYVVCGEQKLDQDDYLIAEGIELIENDIVLVLQISDSQYIVMCKVVSA